MTDARKPPSSTLLLCALVTLGALLASRPAGAADWVPMLTLAGDTLSWTSTPSAVAYDVARGDLGTLRGTAGDFTAATQGCVANDLVRTDALYPDAPARGEGAWFLVRGVLPGGQANETYDEGTPSQVGSRDAEIAATPRSCADTDPEEQDRAQIAQVFGLSYADFVQGMTAMGRTPHDGPGMVGVNGPGFAVLETPDWFTLHHGQDKGSDILSLANGSTDQVTLFIRIVQEQLDPLSPPPSLRFAPDPQPLGSPIYRQTLRTLESSFMIFVPPGGGLSIDAREVRAIGLIAAVAGAFSQTISLGTNYQVFDLGPAFFVADPNAPLCSGVCSPILDPFCWVCGPHYGCPSTHPKCLPTSFSVCWGFVLDEDTCGCFP